MHNTDIQYFRSNNHHINTSLMHNLRSNFDKFFNITKSVLKIKLILLIIFIITATGKRCPIARSLL